MLTESTELKEKTIANARYFREKMEAAGFDLVPGNTAIVPVMVKKNNKFYKYYLYVNLYINIFSYMMNP